MDPGSVRSPSFFLKQWSVVRALKLCVMYVAADPGGYSPSRGFIRDCFQDLGLLRVEIESWVYPAVLRVWCFSLGAVFGAIGFDFGVYGPRVVGVRLFRFLLELIHFEFIITYS